MFKSFFSFSPVDLRPTLKFNSYDNEFKIDRKSLFGLYLVEQGLPLNPSGRTGELIFFTGLQVEEHGSFFVGFKEFVDEDS